MRLAGIPRRHRLGAALGAALGWQLLAGAGPGGAVLGCARGDATTRAVVAARPLSSAPTPNGALREAGLKGSNDLHQLGLNPARLVPESLLEARAWGAEPGGATHATLAGLRVVASSDGSLLAADNRFPSEPSSVVELPERMGGGFLFAVSSRVWRSETWLGMAQPIFASPDPIAQVLVGLDRVYVRYAQGSLGALDARTGARLDLGALPAAPRLGPVAALDAWRAIAIADLRGALVTVDAGNTWKPLPLPIEATDVVALDDAIAVGGRDAHGSVQWWEARFDGPADLLRAPPVRPASPLAFRAPDGVARAFGPRPLATALEDGWPLVDGTALIARNGALGRIRLSDGALVEAVSDAFPMPRARCHPLSLATVRDRDAFGFVCGEAAGETRVFTWSAAESRLRELRTFREPRQVLAFGNGALAARGACNAKREEPSGPGDPSEGRDEAEQDWCVMSPDRTWSDIRVRGTRVAQARLVVLADGRVAILRPPTDGDLSTARLTLVDGAHEVDRAVSIPLVSADVNRALRYGIWMDGFEERRAGVLGGWVDAAGSVVGLEVALDGKAQIGEYIRDAGAPVVAGVWGFGWTASRGGFETTDGGMTWAKEIALPEPIAQPAAGRERVCGALGCVVAGWLRVGWGDRAPATFPDPPLAGPVERWNPRSDLRLQCEPLASPGGRSGTAPGPNPWMSASFHPPATSSFVPFEGSAGPVVPPDDVGFAVDGATGFEHATRVTPSARVYAWGPGAGEWDALGRWQVRWDSPWSGIAEGTRSVEPRSSATAMVPWTTLDGARRGLGIGAVVPTQWAVAFGDDTDHALLVSKRTQGIPSAEVWALESGRAPLEIRRPGGEPLPEVQAALRVEGRWVLATPQPPSETAAAVLWVIDGALAHEAARVPRAGGDVATRLRLARLREGRGIGLSVDGQPDAFRATTTWLTELDLATGASAEPTALARFDVYDPTFPLCTGDDPGWQIERPYLRTVQVDVHGWIGTVRGATGRVRLTRDRACLESIAGSIEPDLAQARSENATGDLGASAGSPDGLDRTIDVSLSFPQGRVPVRCRTLR